MNVWKPEMDTVLLRLKSDGLTYSAISLQFPGLSRHSCRSRWQYLQTRPADWKPGARKGRNSPELVARIKKLWEAGMSGSEIALAMGLGQSRAAVIAIVHRNGLKRSTVASRTRVRAKPAPERRPAKPAAPKPAVATAPDARPLRVVERAPLNLRYEDLGRGCQYGTSEDEGGHLFCGHERALGRPYCVEHVALTTNTRPPLKPRAKPRPDFAAQAQSRRFA